MNAFDNLLREICERPAMYVGDARLRHVAIFLDGVTSGLANSNTENPMAAWRAWVELRYEISDPAWHWTSILIHVFGSDAEALRSFPALFHEYRESVDTMGVDGVEKAHAARFPRRLGHRYVPAALPPNSCSTASK